MELIPVRQHIEENKEFTDHPDCQDSVRMSVDFYKQIGFNPPWICYYVELENCLVGCAAFKGRPINNRVEIAYGVFTSYQNKGIATQIADKLTRYALQTDSTLIVTARTLAEENFSTKVLRKNNFKLLGLINDPEDGELWEWEYVPR